MKIAEKLKKLLPVNNDNAPAYLKLWWDRNTLQGKYDLLLKAQKDGVFNKVLKIIDNQDMMDEKDNRIKELTIKVKEYKEKVIELEELLKRKRR